MCQSCNSYGRSDDHDPEVPTSGAPGFTDMPKPAPSNPLLVASGSYHWVYDNESVSDEAFPTIQAAADDAKSDAEDCGSDVGDYTIVKVVATLKQPAQPTRYFSV